MKKTLSLIFAVAVALTVALFLSSCIFTAKYSYGNSHLYEAGEATLAASELPPVINVSIDWISGGVMIKTDSTDELKVSEQSVAATERDTEQRVYFDGETLFVKAAPSGASIEDIPKKTLTVTLPEGVRVGTVEISAVDADVSLGEISADAVVTDTVSGCFYLIGAEIYDRIEYSTVSGSCAIVPAAAPANIDVHSVSGGTDIKMPNDSGFRLEFTSVSGELINGYDGEASDDGELTVGDGRTLIGVDTVSGNLFIGRQ